MGAVFALYSAWYFWIPKILGVDYNKSGAKAHFWILFVGVNVTFFPQHFLGLQGMPRRISDYPDAFAGWNLVSSLGSIISVIATWLFLYILYVQLVEGKSTSNYPWLTPQFYYDLLQTHLTRSFNSLEWGLNSPPKPHAFVSLPLQSSLNISNILKKITLSRVISTGVTVILMATLRYLYFGGLISNPLDIVESISWAWFGAMFKIILDGVLSEIFIKMGGDYSLVDYLKKSIPTTHFAEDQTPGTSSSPGGSSGRGGSGGKGGSGDNTTSSINMEAADAIIAEGQARLESTVGSVQTGSMQEMGNFMKQIANVPTGYNIPDSMKRELSTSYPLSTEPDEALSLYTQWFNTKNLAMTELKLADYLLRFNNYTSPELSIRKLQCEHISKQCNKGMDISYDKLSQEKKNRIKEIYGSKSWK